MIDLDWSLIAVLMTAISFVTLRYVRRFKSGDDGEDS